jgi:adenylyltransferase/sulfurtransferase
VTDDQLLRYSRHILLPQIGIEGQENIVHARALVIGAGGLGSPAALYLASAGIGTLVLADGDTVDLTNLQRQILHHTDAVGMAKSASGKRTLGEINPECRVVALAERLSGERLDEEVALADIVLDCCDNFATRHAVNRACVKFAKPLVSASTDRWPCSIHARPTRPATTACFPKGRMSMRFVVQ